MLEEQSMSAEEIKKAELEILIAFDNFCKNNNLTYYLCGGTLLGTIRHNGFIPWDDDIDVFMPREDYEKFYDITKNTPIKENYITTRYSNVNNKITYPFMKILDTTILVSEKFMTNNINLWIDIFPIDGLSDSEKERNKHYKKLKKRISLLGIINSDLSYKQSKIKKLVKIIMKPFLQLYGAERLCRKIDNDAKKYEYKNSDFVGCSIWGYGVKEVCHKEIFHHEEHLFEGNYFSIPKGYNEYLSNLYGDYMQLPPIEKRICHGFTAKKIIEEK